MSGLAPVGRPAYLSVMSDEMAMLRDAHRAYLKAAPKLREFYARVIDSLTDMLAEGRTFADPLPGKGRVRD